MKTDYKELLATWEVTTEGDYERRSVKNLGAFTGYVDEIALHLADKAYYGLSFKKVIPNLKLAPMKSSVNVLFHIESGTWDTIKTDNGMKEMIDVFASRPVRIKKSNYYASFVIESVDSESILKAAALKKLTHAEKKILGL